MMSTWLQIVITAVVIPAAGYALRTLYQVGQVMGKINEKLDSHEHRIERLEDSVWPPK